MPNGIEQDVREIRREVAIMQREGCGHKSAHDAGISKLWEAIDAIREGQGVLLRNIVLSVFGVVLALMIANFFVTRQTVQAMAQGQRTVATDVATENQRILKDLAVEIRDIKTVQEAQRDIFKRQQPRK